MGKKEKLFEKAKNSPANVKFDELCRLAEYAGFELRSVKGSHRIYKLGDPPKMMNFQPDKRDGSKAKIYQVRQLVKHIEENGLI